MKLPSDEFADDITDVPGFLVGHATDLDAKTGVTVILPPSGGAVGGIYVGGSAPSTRQMDSLKPYHIVERIHAICLCGGSAFGLDAAGGVLTYLEEHGIGFQVVGRTVPIVPAAAVFDLNFGDGSVRPDSTMGKHACENASSGRIEQGSIGAGTGATVGKLFGIDQAMKGGLGSAAEHSGDLVVGALAVVNAYGDVTDTAGNILAGARTSPGSLEPANSARLLRTGKAKSRTVSVENTTLAVIATNAAMNKTIASRVALQATLGLDRVIRPFHTHIDGDLTIVISAGDVEADSNGIALMAAEALQRSVRKAICGANGFGLLPAWVDRDMSREA